jgi:hypothetical protein
MGGLRPGAGQTRVLQRGVFPLFLVTRRSPVCRAVVPTRDNAGALPRLMLTRKFTDFRLYFISFLFFNNRVIPSPKGPWCCAVTFNFPTSVNENGLGWGVFGWLLSS